MATWAEFETSVPELARLGHTLLLTRGRGYLATVRADGGPRVHVICPVLWSGHLHAGIIKATPKHQDLITDGRYALHAPLGEGDAEFWVLGTARLLTEPEAQEIMRARPEWSMPVTNSLFDLDISSAFGNIFKQGPDNRPIPDRRVFRDDRVLSASRQHRQNTTPREIST